MDAEASGALKPPRLAQRLGLWLGLAVSSALLLIGPPSTVGEPAWHVAALVSLMAIWWVTEAIPIPVTSLLPMVVLPMAGISSMKAAAAPYASPIVMLLLGGFIIAKSIERWNLHERIALHIVVRAGNHPAALVGGFMVAAAFLSMWISNSATTIMLTPIAISVAAAVLGNGDVKGAPFTLSLLLGLAYAASIGGLGTPVGTPTNLIVIGYLAEQTGQEISFAQWMLIGLPAVFIMLPAAWIVVTKFAFPIETDTAHQGAQAIKHRLLTLGAITVPEKRVMVTFALIALAWIIRKPINTLAFSGFRPFEGLSDPLIAIAGAIALFMIPSGAKGSPKVPLLNWEIAQAIPWGVILLFGGGLSLAGAITSSGLAAWLGGELAALTDLSPIVIMLALTAFVIFATEISSNVATASALLPIIGAIASAGGSDPIALAMPVAMAASCAFMLPMATGPNAIIFASGQVSIAQMARAGIRLNLVGVILLTGLSYVLVPLLFSA
ncbi:MAG: SLC13 family permease [Pseudomonadota bacterium]